MEMGQEPRAGTGPQAGSGDWQPWHFQEMGLQELGTGVRPNLLAPGTTPALQTGTPRAREEQPDGRFREAEGNWPFLGLSPELSQAPPASVLPAGLPASSTTVPTRLRAQQCATPERAEPGRLTSGPSTSLEGGLPGARGLHNLRVSSKHTGRLPYLAGRLGPGPCVPPGWPNPSCGPPLGPFRNLTRSTPFRGSRGPAARGQVRAPEGRPTAPFPFPARSPPPRARSDPDTPRLAARGVSRLVVSEPGRILALSARCSSRVPITRAGTWGSAAESGSAPRSPGPVQSEHTPPPAQLTRLAHAGRFPPGTGRGQALGSRARPHRPAAARTGPPLPPGAARAGARSTFFVCSARAPPPPATSPPPRPPRTRPANEARRRRAGPGVLSAPCPPIGRVLHPVGVRPAGPRGGARGPR
ncbi:basic proline-rich protein-like [Zalophus californianus]|uniref:Basic proline-rich protein-like n=1 Tax=Zalophus californianus TaxID=9704 RepID=A0A6J2B2M1_ZALCA|nr:basic proline-rich protein-like [Zalophus californianus]